MRHRGTVARLALMLVCAGATAAACGGSTEPEPRATATASPPTAERTPDTISWDEAVRLITSCEVARGGQAHSRQVWLTLRDGREVTTFQPVLDDLFGVQQQAVAGGCEPVGLWTE
jgi:hypothetical protein